MAGLTYRDRKGHEDGKARASIPVWVHLTREQVAAVEKAAKAAGYKKWRRLLHDIAESAIEKRLKESTHS